MQSVLHEALRNADKHAHATTIEVAAGDWPCRAHGLSARQAEVVSLITMGFSNQQIAQRTHLTMNTVKTYIRMAYRQMGVQSRTQAVLWGIEHGMAPERTTSLLEDRRPAR